MKRFILVLLVLFSSTCAFAQDEAIAEKEKQTRELMRSSLSDESDQTVLREKLDEIKSDLNRLDNHIDQIKGYQEGMELYKANTREMRYDLLVAQFGMIREALLTKDHGRLVLEENRLRKRLMGLIWTLDKRSETGESTAMQSPVFVERIGDIMKNLREDPVINRFMEGKPAEPYIQDTVLLDSIEDVFNKGNTDDIWHDIDTEVRKETERLALELTGLERQKSSLREMKRKITEKLDEEANINGMAILLGLPLFCCTILFLFLGPGYIQARLKSGEENKLLAKSQDVLLDLSTVLLLTMSILILGLSGNINNEVLGTLVGGISGYVLNKTRSS